jgi:FkbM family methyltransferase
VKRRVELLAWVAVREHLLRNLAINAVTQVEVDGAALADAQGMPNFVAPAADDPASASGHVVSSGAAPLDTIRVAASTLDVLAAEKKLDRIDLLKIDAEGFEWPISQGAEQSIVRFRPSIIFEFGRAYAARGSDSGSLFAEFFRRHRYRLFAVGRNWLEFIEDGAWPATANIFASPLPVAGAADERANGGALSLS